MKWILKGKMNKKRQIFLLTAAMALAVSAPVPSRAQEASQPEAQVQEVSRLEALKVQEAARPGTFQAREVSQPEVLQAQEASQPDQPGNSDLAVVNVRWDESDGTAVWDSNSHAKKYQVRLFRSNSAVTSARTTSENYYCFAGSINKRGDYYFEVRALGSGSEKGDWVQSESWYVSASEAEDLRDHHSSGGPGGSTYGSNWGPGVAGGYYDASGYYHGNPYNSYYYGYSGGPGVSGYNGGPGVGSYNGGPGVSGGNGFAGGPGVVTGSGSHWCLDQYGWWYQFADGTYPRNCWQCIDNRWYCFNSSGYIRYGWIQYNQNWYYCGPDGALLANTRTPDGYYVGEGGVWIP